VTHIHDGDTSRVQLVDDVLGGYANSTNEKSYFFVNDDVDQGGQLAFGIVKLETIRVSRSDREGLGGTCYVSLSSVSTNLRNKEVNPEWGILVNQCSFQGLDLKDTFRNVASKNCIKQLACSRRILGV
jgi:hypothetical protein